MVPAVQSGAWLGAVQCNRPQQEATARERSNHQHCGGGGGGQTPSPQRDEVANNTPAGTCNGEMLRERLESASLEVESTSGGGCTVAEANLSLCPIRTTTPAGVYEGAGRGCPLCADCAWWWTNRQLLQWRVTSRCRLGCGCREQTDSARTEQQEEEDVADATGRETAENVDRRGPEGTP